MSFSRSDASAALELARRRPPPTGSSALSQKVLPSTAAWSHELALEWLQRVQAGRQQTLDGVGQLRRGGGRPPRRCAAPSPRRTAGSRPSARRARPACSLIAPEARSSASISACASSGGERFQERDRGGPPHRAPAGPALEQLVARQAHLQDRRPQPAGQVVDQVERALVGPVDVLPREHQRPAPAASASSTARTAPKKLSRALLLFLLLGERLVARRRRRRAGVRAGAIRRSAWSDLLVRAQQRSAGARQLRATVAASSPSAIPHSAAEHLRSSGQ